MPYEEFQRLIGKSGLSIKEFAALLDMQSAHDYCCDCDRNFRYEG